MSNDIMFPLDLPQVRVMGEPERRGRTIEVKVVQRNSSAICPRCGYCARGVHQRHVQSKLDIPLHEWTLVLVKRRFRCPQCRKPFTEPDQVCGWRKRTTKRLRRKLYESARHQTVKRVAQEYGVGERLVRESFNRYADEERGKAGLEQHSPTVLGVDDFSVRKGHRYQTLFGDVQSRRRLEVVDGRDGGSARGYLERLGEPEKVKVVVMDMSEAYRGAVELCLPKAAIVVDKMHAVGLVNRSLDRVRLRIQREAGEGGRKAIYAARYLLLRNPESLKEQDRQHLRQLLREYPELRRAWQLKEDFRRWYREADIKGALLGLRAWEREVEAEGPKEFRALSPTLQRWCVQIINYFRYRVTNGYMEGSNNRTKAIQRQAYGYRNRGNLRRRILLPKAA